MERHKTGHARSNGRPGNGLIARTRAIWTPRFNREAVRQVAEITKGFLYALDQRLWAYLFQPSNDFATVPLMNGEAYHDC
jgi:hypothetical protein